MEQQRSLNLQTGQPLPLVSVIMATYNRAQYIRAALESILQQPYAPLEIIVVDDGSTDNTGAVVQALLDETAAPIRCATQANQGLPAAHNHGLRLARGSIIAFLDSDDLWQPQRLPAQLAWFTPDALDSRTAPGIVLSREERFADNVVVNASELTTANAREICYTLGSSLIARWVFDVVGAFDETLRYSADWDWFLRARTAGIPMVVYPNITLRVRIHDNNMTRDRAAGGHFLAQMVKQHLDRQRRTEDMPTPATKETPLL